MKVKELAYFKNEFRVCLESKDTTLPTKVCMVKAMVFPVVMYRWDVRAERWEFILSNCDNWRSLLRVPWTARRSNQSILKEINPEYSLEGLMLKLQYFRVTWWEELTHWKRGWCWKRLSAGGEGGNRGWDGWMASPTQWTWVWASSRRSWRTGKSGVPQSMGLQSWMQLGD